MHLKTFFSDVAKFSGSDVYILETSTFNHSHQPKKVKDFLAEALNPARPLISLGKNL